MAESALPALGKGVKLSSIQCPLKAPGLALCPQPTDTLLRKVGPLTLPPHCLTSGLDDRVTQQQQQQRRGLHSRAPAPNPDPLPPPQARTLRALTGELPPLLPQPLPPPLPEASLTSELFPESHNVLDTLVMGGGGVEEH